MALLKHWLVRVATLLNRQGVNVRRRRRAALDG
jgi:hypothetical protein